MSNIAHKNVYQIEQELHPPYDANRDPSREESNKYVAQETPVYEPHLDPAALLELKEYEAFIAAQSYAVTPQSSGA